VKKRILIVDDEDRVLLILAEALKRLGNGYEIVTAGSGAEALIKARQQTFDLLITDLKMSIMGGTELTRSIKELSPETAVIWITAYGCHNVAAEFERLDVHCCLDKPLEIGAIRRAAMDALTALTKSKDGTEGGQSHET
jgi:two-component system, cell cycle response regulator CpdR